MDFLLVARAYDVATNTTDFGSVISSTPFTLLMSAAGGFTTYIGGVVEQVISLSSMNLNESCRFYIITSVMRNNFNEDPEFKLGAFSDGVGCGTLQSSIRVDWQGYSVNNAYEGEVDVPACIDPDITQKDFLKDIFCLLYTSDAADEP